MPALLRNSSPRGPRFYEDDGELLFMHVFDPNTVDGPRHATDEDRVAHPAAYAEYERRAADPGVQDVFPGVKPPVTFKGEPPEDLPEIKARGSKAPA